MKNAKGFTLVELVIVIAIVGILAAIAVPAITGKSENPMFSQSGPRGMRVTAGSIADTISCEGSFKIIRDTMGTRQMLDENGHGIKCDK